MPYPPLRHRRGRKWVIKAIRFLYCHTLYMLLVIQSISVCIFWFMMSDLCHSSHVSPLIKIVCACITCFVISQLCHWSHVTVDTLSVPASHASWWAICATDRTCPWWYWMCACVIVSRVAVVLTACLLNMLLFSASQYIYCSLSEDIQQLCWRSLLTLRLPD